jgi:hypothetical protein
MDLPMLNTGELKFTEMWTQDQGFDEFRHEQRKTLEAINALLPVGIC